MFSLIEQRIFVAKVNDRGRKNLGSEYWRRIQVRNTVSKTERHLAIVAVKTMMTMMMVLMMIMTLAIMMMTMMLSMTVMMMMVVMMLVASQPSFR